MITNPDTLVTSPIERLSLRDPEPSVTFNTSNSTPDIIPTPSTLPPPSSSSPTFSSAQSSSLPPHLSHDPTKNLKRSDPFQFGSRYLDETTDDVFEFNAWDHVIPDAAHTAYCESQYAHQRANPASDFDRTRINANPAKWWDLFYKQKSATFFKDRKWLRQEFPVLEDVTRKEAGEKVVLEVGAGAGNTAFPILRENENERLRIWACDFSEKAIATIRSGGEYGSECLRAEVWDVASPELPAGLEEGMVDVVIMIFIFSALEPKQWRAAVQNIYRLLKPGGVVLFRDYGRGDLAQVRFKEGRWMAENFYTRGDGTRVYFFEKKELEDIWGGEDKQEPRQAKEEKRNEGEQATIQKDDSEKVLDEKSNSTADASSILTFNSSPRFKILNLNVDRRLIVNRQRRLKMYRCWIQGRFQKPG